MNTPDSSIPNKYILLSIFVNCLRSQEVFQIFCDYELCQLIALYYMYMVLSWHNSVRRIIMKKIYSFLIAFNIITLAGCSSMQNNISSSPEIVQDEAAINSQNIEEYNKVVEKHNGKSDTMSLAINVDEKGKVLEKADVKIVSAISETGKITHFDGIDQRWQKIAHYERYFDDNGALLPEYVFAEITVEICSDKSWDELLLTSFQLRYISNGEAGTKEPHIIDKCIDCNNPHKGTTISIEANNPKLVTLGYIIPKEKFDSITEAYLYGRFAQFDIMDNADGSLPVEFSNK